MIVVLSDEVGDRYSVNANEIKAITEAAKLSGNRVFYIPRTFDECGTAENALAYAPEFETPVPGIWIGFIPALERYTAIYDAAAKKGIKLINTPHQHQIAMEFDQFYPHLEGLTPKSIILNSPDDLPRIEAELGYPVFVKGSVKSNKDKGWGAVTAQNRDELKQRIETILLNAHRSRGKAIIRQIVPIRHTRMAPDGFPVGREYRIFLYKTKVLAYSFYWDEFSDSEPLNQADKETMLQIAIEAACRVDVSYISVDTGQLESGEWIVIEIGDGQFSGLSHIPPLELWSKIKNLEW